MEGHAPRGLRALGLTWLEELAYVALVGGPGRSAAELAAETGADPRRLDRALARLTRLRLVHRLPGGGLAPSAPDVALPALRQRREAELAEVTAVAEQLAATFRAGARPGCPDGLVEVVSGRHAVVDRHDAVVAGAVRELLVLDAPPRFRPPGEWPRGRPGVVRRSIHAQPAHGLPRGERVRTSPELPTALLIADGRVGLLPLTGGAEHLVESALLVRRSALLKALLALFEMLWAQAAPVTAAEPVLLLLATGLKDEAIARQLGVSPRTARRRIAELLRRLGASTRFQAGLQASRRGWL